MRLGLLILILFILVFSSCKKDDSPEQDLSVTMLNVSYGTNNQQKMDVYLPATRSTATTKVIIMIHGGGWNTGDKTDFNEYVDSLKKESPLTQYLISITGLQILQSFFLHRSWM
jgi:acetyl esterase/lipase